MYSIFLSKQAKKFLSTCDDSLRRHLDELFGMLMEDPLPLHNYDIAKTHKENVDAWDINLEKVNEFFKNNQQSWENKLNEWNADFEKRQSETKEQWEARKLKINDDIKNWQDKSKKDWEKGLKTFRREMMKGSYMFLLFMIPILVVLFIIVALVTRLFDY